MQSNSKTYSSYKKYKMPFSGIDNSRNSPGNFLSNAYYPADRQYLPPACAFPLNSLPPQNHIAPNQMPFYSCSSFMPHQIHFNPMIRPKHAIVDHNINFNPNFNMSDMQFARKQSPMKNPVPIKRHRLNEAANNENGSQSSNDGISGLEVDSLFYELQRFASEGSIFAESVARNYRKRPCFKKIELLLTRLRQELTVYHNITSNLNSQGTAWAIKDFIFVFSRIVNAWTIMRGYIYDKTDGLDELRKEFHHDFVDSFIQWQESTLKMMKTLMGTVENMDYVTQTKSGCKQKKKENFIEVDSDAKVYGKEFLDDFQKNLFAPKFIQNSDEIQIRNHKTNSYFSAGTFKPLKNVSNDFTANLLTPETPKSETDGLSWISYDDLNDSQLQFPSSGSSGRLYNRKCVSLPVTPFEKTNVLGKHEKSRARKDLSTKFSSIAVYNNDIEAELEKEFGNLDFDGETDDCEDERLKKLYGDDGHKVVYLLQEISKISQLDNLSVGMSMIVENIKNGKFADINDVLDEFKTLVKHAKGIIENSKDNNEKVSVKKFIGSLEAVINRKAFE